VDEKLGAEYPLNANSAGTSSSKSSAVVKIRRLQQQLQERMSLSATVWPEKCFPLWSSLEDAMVTALLDTSSGTRFLRTESQLSDAVMKSISAIDDRLESKTMAKVQALTLQISDEPSPTAHSYSLRLHSLLSVTRNLCLLELVAECAAQTRESDECLEHAQSRISSYLAEMSQMSAKCSELEEQLQAVEQSLSGGASAHKLASISVAEWMCLSDEVLLDNQANLEAALSRVKTARSEVARKKNDGDRDRGDSLCCICRDQVKSILLLPCRHLCVCSLCIELRPLTHCPMCRTPATQFLRVFS
jgi:hypothetical protein